jgi:hypothetical protein
MVFSSTTFGRWPSKCMLSVICQFKMGAVGGRAPLPGRLPGRTTGTKACDISIAWGLAPVELDINSENDQLAQFERRGREGGLDMSGLSCQT